MPEHSIEFGSWSANPEVLGAMNRIRVVADSALNHYHQSRIVFHGAEGQQESQTVSVPARLGVRRSE